jgi:hypothetical protein
MGDDDDGREETRDIGYRSVRSSDDGYDGSLAMMATVPLLSTTTPFNGHVTPH